MQELSHLSDDELLRNLHALVGSQRRAMAHIVAHLGEVDVRRIYAKRGFSSLFSYSVEQLRFSEDEACRRIEAARLARRFPCIYELLDSGAVTLTVLALLKPHLTDENHQELFAGVSGASVRLAKEWLAELFPRPDVSASIRRHPAARPLPSTAPSGTLGTSSTAAGASLAPRARSDVSPASARIQTGLLHALLSPSLPALNDHEGGRADRGQRALLPSSSPAPTVLPEHGVAVPAVIADLPREPELTAAGCAPGVIGHVEPLSRDRFVVKLTVSRAVRDKLDLARDLMRHRSPSGDLAVVIERALDALLVELARTKLGQTNRSQRKPRTADPARVTSATRREVFERDGLGCSFVAPDGRRCGARAFLEFDHETPKARGGSSEPSNVRLLCRTHNQLAAVRIFGEEHMRQALSSARTKQRSIERQ